MTPVPHEVLRELSRRSDARGLLQLAGHAALIALAAAVVLRARHGPWLLPAMAVLGVLEAALFTPLHETTHRTPFRSLWLNRAVGCVAGFVLVLPPERFRLFHVLHHRHAQDPVRDPELLGLQPLTRARYWLRLSGLPYWREQVGELLATAAGRTDHPWIRPEERAAVVREARGYVAAYLLLALAAGFARSPLPLLLWVGPVLLGQPALRYLLLAEHAGCPLSDDGYANTRTTLAGAWLRFIFWNANYHAEHHLAPAVPFHRLPELHARLHARLRCVAPSYAAAHRPLRAGLAA